MKARVGILADNVALWGDPNVVVVSDDPRAFAPLAGYFDIRTAVSCPDIFLSACCIDLVYGIVAFIFGSAKKMGR